MALRLLISGASVAGNAAAWWLTRHGHDVTVIEKASGFRADGQNIDVRGTGREVLRRMHLEQAALDRGTGELGTAWVNEQGETVAEFKAGDGKPDGPTAEMEILRGDLAKLLYEAVNAQAAYRFGETIAAVEEATGGVDITFRGGAAERYDALIVAEGVGSSTREMLFPGENDPRWMDLTTAYFTIPRAADDDRMWRWFNAPGGRSVSLRPDNHGTTRAVLTIQQPSQGEQDWSVDRQKAFLRERFDDAGWQAPRVLAGMNHTRDFYFDVLRQVRTKRWSSGRTVLLGDAAWCATPLAGIGATLAITGAYVLAGELTHAADTAAAFTHYERFMRPIVEKGQDVPKIGPRLMHPRSRLGVHLLHGALSVASSHAMQEIAARFLTNSNDEVELPNYELHATESSGGCGSS